MKSVIQFLKFGLVGISNTLISLGIYYLFLWYDPDLYLIGNCVGFVVSTMNAYLLNSRFVFQKNSDDENKSRLIIRTYGAYMLGLLTQTALLFIFVDKLHIPETIAPILTLFVTVPLNFLMNKFWVYRTESSR